MQCYATRFFICSGATLKNIYAVKSGFFVLTGMCYNDDGEES